MSWYWESYSRKSEWSYVYFDGEYADEIGSITKKNGMYEAYASGSAIRQFKFLTDAKRYVEMECRGKYTTKKRKALIKRR